MNTYKHLMRPSLFMFIVLFFLMTYGCNDVKQKKGKSRMKPNNTLTKLKKRGAGYYYSTVKLLTVGGGLVWKKSLLSGR